MSGRKSKVIQFPTATRRRIVCQYLSGTTTGQYHNLKENEFPWGMVIGTIVGLLYVSILFL